MKNKKFLSFCLAFAAAGACISLSSCSSGPTITLWVGSESASFYQQMCNDYKAAHPDFGYSVQVTGTDTGSNAGSMVSDYTACGDIITIAHDNIGKLVDKNLLVPLDKDGKDLANQVEQDNPDAFKGVISYKWASDNQTHLFAAPYISQSLVLYYNKAIVSEKQAETFEGLTQAATVAGCKALTVTGDDGYNFSFTVLARNARTNTSTLKLYEGGVKSKGSTDFQGDDMIATTKWAQRVTADPNGFTFPTDAGWESSIKNTKVAAIVGGAWHKAAFVAAAGGESNVGITVLPTFKLTAADVLGTSVAANTQMRFGTFSDCKTLVINANSVEKDAAKYAKEIELIKYLSSKTVQLESFKQCDNMPAYVGADQDIEAMKSQLSEVSYKLATSQAKMNNYGMPQPFINGTLNSYYYSMQGPSHYKNMIINVDGSFSSVEAIRLEHYNIQFIWQRGKAASVVPDELPAEPYDVEPNK